MELNSDKPTIADLIAKWPKPSLPTFAADAGITYEAAKQCRRRNFILPKYWPAIIEAATRREIEGVTAESMLAIHAATVDQAEAADAT